MKRIARFLFSSFLHAFLFCAFFNFADAQSTEQNFPTPIKQSQLIGKIAARDIGDSRLTTYFFTFNGEQGDIFLNIEARNLNGDIDIFEAETLRPLSKIRLFADFSADEILRTIYLRKAEKLILRIEGRTPNDDPATFKIQFTGSFIPSADVASGESSIPKVAKKTNSDVEVNSVGTIIAVKPKETPKPTPRVEVAKVERPKRPAKTKTVDSPKVEKPKVEVPKANIPKASVPKVEKPKPEVAKPTVKKPEKSTVEKAKPKVPVVAEKPSKKLIVVFQDGTIFRKSMDEVLKFSVERETLTIISKTGEIKRYSISDVVKLSIE